MEPKRQILDIPRALRDTLEKGRPEYEALIRQTRWGEGPIYLCSCGAAAPASLAGAYAFEFLLGWPAVARSATVFESYSLGVLRPRAVVLVISASGEAPEALELARQARSHGATVLALTGNSCSPLTQVVDGVFLTRGEAAGDAPATSVCQHAALAYIALVAAKTLKRPTPQLKSIEEEFGELPRQVEWALTQLPDAIRSLASELQNLGRLALVGGGFYHAPALRGARRLRELAGMDAEAVEASEFPSFHYLRRDDACLFLCGSRSRIKKTIHDAAAQAKAKGARILSLTDSNDRELAERSELAILTTTLTEVAGSTLTLSLLEWLAVEVAHGARPGRAAARS